MKVVFWMLLIGAAIAFARRWGGGGRTVHPSPREGRSFRTEANSAPTQADLMMACSVCQVHIPASEAVFAHGRVYCCEAHRAQDQVTASGDGRSQHMA
ncbi:MAG: PP0621 family protein [Lautropia sp.]|nr:PP0621 family protein [Lautropia sp.]